MAENKKSFILYCDQKGVWDKLNNEQAGKLIKHIIAYVNDENPQTDDFITELAFEPIKQHLKRDLKKWEKQYDQRVEAGKKSAESRKRNSTSVDERSVSSTDNVSVNGSVNVNATVNENVNVSERKTRGGNKPPTVQVEEKGEVEEKGKDNTSPSFQDFWNKYDKKIGKPKAESLFNKLVQSEREQIMKHLTGYVKTEKRFRKDPERYLKNRSWEDELIDSSFENNLGHRPSLPNFI